MYTSCVYISLLIGMYSYFEVLIVRVYNKVCAVNTYMHK